MYTQERHIKLLEHLQAQGSVSVAQLSEIFQVSEVTIRSDLNQLARQKLLIRTHGGAMVDAAGQLSMALRQKRQVEEKERIGRAAAELIQDNQAIFLDSSSTALAVAQHIVERQHLTVITNGLWIVEALLQAPGIHIVVPGGHIRKDTASIVNSDGRELIQGYNIQLGFFGAHGLSIDGGLTDVSHEEASFKQPVVGLCKQVVAVIDSTKWGQEGPASFATIEQLDRVISDGRPPAALMKRLRAAEVELVLA